MEFKIYTLTDPISNQVRYVGVTSQTLKRRFSKHIVDSNRGKKSKRRNFSDEQVVKIKEMKKNHTCKEIANIFSVKVFVIKNMLYSKKKYIL